MKHRGTYLQVQRKMEKMGLKTQNKGNNYLSLHSASKHGFESQAEFFLQCQWADPKRTKVLIPLNFVSFPSAVFSLIPTF